MFDIGFSELLVVALVALLVIGPEGMPEAVHKALATWRTVKRSLHNARRDVEREMGVDDIRRRIHNEEVMRHLNASQDAIEAVRQDLNLSTALTSNTPSNEAATANPPPSNNTPTT